MVQVINMSEESSLIEPQVSEESSLIEPQVKTTMIKNHFQMEITLPSNIKNLIFEKIYKIKKAY
ncbi:hypothetical protein SlsnVgp107 [Spodoptera littoralis nucleopolyhedrovirus]|uniref:Uncharacterized protein n=1 Tax=Spodoptera littoralis nuclear polyhedrosis virus TaxID=10456 RepID=M1JSN3_NPVSL|nr:hypothetical protein SlsnVgp107 [Spodoptera littoralis nucleopolyhedrovirus]AGE89962.1 hypothetical protein SlsnVgp107 [Spodoptera littoralis nucleopolyhedrovirus]